MVTKCWSILSGNKGWNSAYTIANTFYVTAEGFAVYFNFDVADYGKIVHTSVTFEVIKINKWASRQAYTVESAWGNFGMYSKVLVVGEGSGFVNCKIRSNYVKNQWLALIFFLWLRKPSDTRVL